MSIRLSEKHGLNATIPVCFFCNEPTGELSLLGRLSGDREAPKYIRLNKKPCEKCIENFSKGFTILEMDKNNELTGNFWVISLDAAKETFSEEIVAFGKVKVERSVIKELGLYNLSKEIQ